VVAIGPDVDALPRNALRLAITFSAPMSEGFAASCVRVEQLDGTPVRAPFAPLDPELWDAGRRTITVLFDPARIKRGLVSHRAVGYPLAVGTPVRVVVDARWPDAAGQPLVASAERTYAVGADERRRVDPSAWVIEPAAAGTLEPLVVRFDRPLDAVLLSRCLSVRGVEGRAAVGEGQEAWSWLPAAPWAEGPHELVVDTRLEDLAGNAVARVFDREVTVDPAVDVGPTVVLPFRPVSPRRGAR
jgi:hypothetical protein